MRLGRAGIFFALGLSACAIPTRQTDALLASKRDIPDAVTVPGVPFIEQKANYCGPASLAMAMAKAGRPIPVDVLAAQSYSPERKGALQVDLVGAARRKGMMAVQIEGLSALLHELAAGHPVITLENQGLSWHSRWHYAVAVGYDLSKPALIQHSGPDASTVRDLRTFERCWQDSGYWGLVVLPPGQLAAGGTELAHATAAAALEQLGKAADAERAFRAMLVRWPKSLPALIGMGNVRAYARDYAASEHYLSQAVAAYPKSGAAWHNLALVQFDAGKKALARQSAAQALTLATENEAAVFGESLKKALGGE